MRTSVQIKNKKIAVIGLGYVGLPLAILLSNHFETVGYDIDENRITQLKKFNDITNEISSDKIKNSKRLHLTSNINDLIDTNIYIVTVPTPVDDYNRPNLEPLQSASSFIGEQLSIGDIVVYESTVFPGCTEEICIPILEKSSNLVFNKDFYVGYSPERVNPGDKLRSVETITKVVSGSTDQVTDFLVNLYGKIIHAGIHRAPNIKVAEGAKVIENIQRDLNIALMNELAVFFDKLDIKMNDVLEAAKTKWNFLDFKPGLVGGHCISVDPYYLLHKAQELDFYPEVVWAARRANISITPHIFGKSIRLMNKKGTLKENSNVLIAGFSFKENCPDVRNTRVYDLYLEYENSGFHVDIYDPVVSKETVFNEYNLNLLDEFPKNKEYGLILIAVKHDEIKKIGLDGFKKIGSKNSIIFDVKSIFDREKVDASL
jgi:UDP-N-acetyl-D-galactosamine dehydrogenase